MKSPRAGIENAGEMKNPGADREWTRSPVPPLALLFLALATTFLFGGDRGYFYRNPFDGHLYRAPVDGHVTWINMTVAENLAPEHHFLGFLRQTLDAAGTPSYEPYNRFPVLGHVLIKLVTLPFPDDLSARLFAARMLMLTFATAAATLAYLALCRLVGTRWVALAATLLAFSSYYPLYCNDLVATEGVVGLFGVLLVFHGMAVAATEHRHGQLLAKTCVALLLDWHVYAIVGPFVLFGLGAAWRRRDGQALRRHVRLGAVAMLFGAVVLAGNFAREYVALGGEGSLAELPAVQSMLKRTGLFKIHKRNWPSLVEKELDCLGLASVPYAASSLIGNVIPGCTPPDEFAGMDMYGGLGILGIVVAVSALLLVVFSPAIRGRLPLAALVVVRPCWMVAVPYSYVYLEKLFYIGIPLVLFALMLVHLDRLCRGEGRVTTLAGIAAVPVFVLSNLLMAQTSQDPERAALERTLTTDIESIRELVEGKTIFVSANRSIRVWYLRRAFYFTGSVLVSSANRHLADFVVAEQIVGARPLTPDNALVFLYEPSSYDAAMAATLIAYKQSVRQDVPVVHSSDYAVYFLQGDRHEGPALLYLRDDCPAALFRKRQPQFFLHVFPVDPTDLPRERQRFGFDNLDFDYHWYWRGDGSCYAVLRLPAYRIAKIRTGQFRRLKGGRYQHLWGDNFLPIEATDGAPRSSPSRRRQLGARSVELGP